MEDVLPGGIQPVQGAPIFLGHYWFSREVAVETDKVAVLDWGAAHRGPLVACRWDGEQQLSDEKFVVVNV